MGEGKPDSDQLSSANFILISYWQENYEIESCSFSKSRNNLKYLEIVFFSKFSYELVKSVAPFLPKFWLVY